MAATSSHDHPNLPITNQSAPPTSGPWQHNVHQKPRHHRKHRHHAQGVSTASGGAPTTASAPLQAIAACESGGNPSAVGGGGAFRGKYQFDQATWESVGGTGDPAAASPAEQDRRAAILYAREGSSPWPVCGR
jgi:Transglycosylase-like domain